MNNNACVRDYKVLFLSFPVLRCKATTCTSFHTLYSLHRSVKTAYMGISCHASYHS